MEALDAPPSATDSAGRSVLGAAGSLGVPLGGVAGVGSRQLAVIDGSFCGSTPPAASRRLTAATSARPDEPVTRVGIGVPSSSNGALRITTGVPVSPPATS